MSVSRSLVAGLTLSLAALAPAVAQQVVYQAPLLGSSEVPVVATPGSGFGTVTIDFDLLTMRVQASFSGLIGTTTASHIHCCALPGANAAVATQTPTFAGFPLGVTAGVYDNTFDMSLASSYNASFIANNGGTVASAFSVLVAGLDAGKAYLNIHTSAFGGGEIRGLLTPVPEASSVAMMLGGLALLGAVARRRRPA